MFLFSDTWFLNEVAFAGLREEANGKEEKEEKAIKDMVQKAMANAQCICST
jgi:hypothetical protein